MLFSFPAFAGGPEEGELFGYRLGEVYEPNASSMFGHLDAYKPESLSEQAKLIGLNELSVALTPKSHVGYFIRVEQKLRSFDEAKKFLQKISDLFKSDSVDVDLVEAMKLNEIPVTPLQNQTWEVNKSYIGRFDNRFELNLTLFRSSETFGKDTLIILRYNYIPGTREWCNIENLNVKESDLDYEPVYSDPNICKLEYD